MDPEPFKLYDKSTGNQFTIIVSVEQMKYGADYQCMRLDCSKCRWRSAPPLRPGQISYTHFYNGNGRQLNVHEHEVLCFNYNINRKMA